MVTGSGTSGKLAKWTGTYTQGDATNTDTDVADAVTKKHTQNTDTDLDATFEATFVKKADYTAKGDIPVGTGAGTITALGVGTNEHVLTADSTQVTGIKWAEASGGIEKDTAFPPTGAVGDALYRTDLIGLYLCKEAY